MKSSYENLDDDDNFGRIQKESHQQTCVNSLRRSLYSRRSTNLSGLSSGANFWCFVPYPGGDCPGNRLLSVGFVVFYRYATGLHVSCGLLLLSYWESIA